MRKTYGSSIGVILFLLLTSAVSAQETTVKSPDGLVVFRFLLKDGKPGFAITSKNQWVLNTSPLVFSVNNEVITEQVTLGTVSKYSINENYPWLGVHAVANNHCNGARITLAHHAVKYTLDVRVFNDGVGFRVIVPGAVSDKRVPDEATVFNLPKGSSVWYHDFYMHYEGVHTKKEISLIQKGEWVAPPAAIQLSNKTYIAITEADLKNYGGMGLEANGNNGLVARLPHNQPTSYPYRLRYSAEDTARLLQPAVIEGTITTPWRVVMIGKDLNTMVNSDIVHNLCEAPDKKLFPAGIHTGWIKPGRAVWKYLDGGGDGTLEVMKKFTDGAAALGFEHNILEGFWTKWTDAQLKELVDYSKKKNVGIWLWQHSKSLRDPIKRVAFFKHCNELGITGLKIDFFDHEAKEVIDLYESIFEETAKYHLLVDFHGANKPTGLSRTWPNEMTVEAVKGMESSKLLDRATHETTIPFTRLLAGPAEYTVMLFSDRKRNTSIAHQIASAAILSAPMLTYAANPENILASPAVSVIKDIPAVWDETIVLPGSEIGEMAAFARRKGNSWFIAVMNGDAAKKIEISLGFLKKLSGYTATEVQDDSSGNTVVMGNKKYRSTDKISLDLIAGGGYIAELVQQ
ncbi:MAG: glycoside hydrolase family 97 catalytic domain-containing protein [Bacteroidota bacterium]